MPYNNPNYALQLGRSVDRAYGPNKAYSFIYPFIRKQDDSWIPDQSGYTNLAGMGILLPAGLGGEIALNMNYDYNFKLKWFKYSAYYYDSQSGKYLWWEPVAGWQYEQGDYQTAIGTPLINSIKVSVILVGSQQRVLYGGANLDGQVNVNWNRLPVDCSVLQGYDYGIGQLYTPYLLAKGGTILFQFQNTHTIKNLLVTGMAYGTKVRL